MVMEMSEELSYPPFSIRADSSKPARIVQDPEGKLWLLYYDLDGQVRKAPLSLVLFPQELGNLAAQIPVQDLFQQLRVKLNDSAIMVPVDIQGRLKGYTTLYSGTVTASGNSSDSDLSVYGAMEVLIKVTGVSGTSPTLGVYVEGKFEATGDYKTLASQTGINATGTWPFTVNPLIFKLVRVRWVVGGTSPSFTFSVQAQTMV
jgi:hypothetical protein